MDSPFLGAVALLGFSYAPRGWAFCQGQLLPINQNQALFSLLGTMYGGDGRTTFALPDLRGRVPIGFGQGPGLSDYSIGQVAGQESVTLNSAQLPAHTHALKASSSLGNQPSPEGNVLADTGNFDTEYYNGAPTTTMDAQSIGATGGGQPVGIVQPCLTLNYAICLSGLFPSRN